ncbi:MAG: HDOD domain-containing protein [Candidatus Eisenbacteria bacterium]
MDYFIARQPILDHKLRNIGYELLFRSGTHNAFTYPDIDHASRSVIADSSLLFGLRTLVENKLAYFNVTREVLLSGHATILPADQVVVEIMETVSADPAVLAALVSLRERGYTIALDDFVDNEGTAPLIPHVQIIKLDFLASTEEERQHIIKRWRRRGLRFLAEKVETEAAVEEAQNLGCSLFQGYFFSKPIIVRGRDLGGAKLQYLRLLQQVQRPELDFEDLEQVVKHDLSVSYKLLRYTNSAAFGFRREIRSLQESLRLLGEREVRKVLSLILLTALGRDRPEQLITDSVVRARFCEELAPSLGLRTRAQDLFLLGMFSMIDAVVGRPMDEVLTELPIAADLKDALLGTGGELRSVLDFVVAYERGEWERLEDVRSELSLSKDDGPEAHLKAVAWSQESLHATNEDTGGFERRLA